MPSPLFVMTFSGWKHRRRRSETATSAAGWSHSGSFGPCAQSGVGNGRGLAGGDCVSSASIWIGLVACFDHVRYAGCCTNRGERTTSLSRANRGRSGVRTRVVRGHRVCVTRVHIARPTTLAHWWLRTTRPQPRSWMARWQIIHQTLFTYNVLVFNSFRCCMHTPSLPYARNTVLSVNGYIHALHVPNP